MATNKRTDSLNLAVIYAGITSINLVNGFNAVSQALGSKSKDLIISQGQIMSLSDNNHDTVVMGDFPGELRHLEPSESTNLTPKSLYLETQIGQ